MSNDNENKANQNQSWSEHLIDGYSKAEFDAPPEHMKSFRIAGNVEVPAVIHHFDDGTYMRDGKVYDSYIKGHDSKHSVAAVVPEGIATSSKRYAKGSASDLLDPSTTLGTARTSTGSPVFGRPVQANDRVMLPVGMEVLAAQAADLGFLVRNPDGSFSEPEDKG